MSDSPERSLFRDLVSTNGKKRDVNLDCPAVQEYRNIVHLRLNYLQRQFVVDKISCCERGLALWRATLNEFMLEGRNPRNVVYMVKVWEGSFFCNPEVRFTQWKPGCKALVL